MDANQSVELTPDHEHIALCDLLKLAGVAESGAAAKHHIAEGQVLVDGIVETRKRCKIRRGQTVEFAGVRLSVA